MALERNDKGQVIVRLDGSVGLGTIARVTIITSSKTDGTVNETYEFPYTLIDTKTLQSALEHTYILGYKIEKMIPQDEEPTVLRFGRPTPEDEQ